LLNEGDHQKQGSILGNNFIGDIMLGASAALILVVSTTFLLFCFGQAGP